MKQNKSVVFIVSIVASILGITSCSDPVVLPKPRAYPKVEYPKKIYVDFDQIDCGFTFEYPQYAKVVNDSLFFGQTTEDKCWFDLNFPTFNANVHFSYSPITSKGRL